MHDSFELELVRVAWFGVSGESPVFCWLKSVARTVYMRLECARRNGHIALRDALCVSPLATPYKSKTHAGDLDFL